MSFLKKEKYKDLRKGKTPFFQKRGWKIFLISFISLLVVFAGVAAYFVSTGSKIFEKGIGGSALIDVLNGKETIKGESEDRINILLLGMGGANHPGGLLSDSIMVVSVKPKEKKVAMLSIPRDLYVDIKGYGGGKINSAFYDGYNEYMTSSCSKKNQSQCQKDAMSAGGKLSSEVVSEVVGLPIHYYMTVEFDGFEKIIDLLGGIDVNVEKEIYDPYFPDEQMKGYAPFRIKAGMQHMNGETALKYARSRETTSDFDRAARQQKIILAVRDKASKTDFFTNPKKILDIFSSLTDSLYTNFSAGELRSFFEIVKDADTNTAVSKVLKTGPNGELVDYNNGTYYLKPKTGNFKEIQKLASEIFGDISEKESAKVEIQNGVLELDNSKLLALSREIENIKTADFTVTKIVDAEKVYAKTVIYDYTDGTKNTALNELKNKLNLATPAQKAQGNGSIDFKIIIGADYNN